MNILAFDFGVKSIGVAQVNLAAAAITGTCNELPPLPAKEGIPNWLEVEKLLTQWQPERLVVGLPFDSKGEDMEITRRARKFGNRLNARFKIGVIFIDETLSTKTAKAEAHQRGHQGNYAKQPIDSIAARLILESWLREIINN